MEFDLFFILGILGMLLVLIGFLMLQRHKWTADDTAYDLVNFLGAGLLVVYAIPGRAWPFIILNGIYALYSLKELIVDVTQKRR
jgi:lipid-A-disaccharide synthase-like uncharacterized protein